MNVYNFQHEKCGCNEAATNHLDFDTCRKLLEQMNGTWEIVPGGIGHSHVRVCLPDGQKAEGYDLKFAMAQLFPATS